MKSRGLAVIIVCIVIGGLCGVIAWMSRSPAPEGGSKSAPPVVSRFTVPPTSAPLPGANAADIYRQAMLRLAELRRDPADQAQFDRYSEGVFDAQTEAFLKKNGEITELIRQGAAATTVNWGEMDMQSRINDLNSVRSLLNLIMMESKFAMQRDNAALAIDDALAGMAMAHHLGRGGMIASRLVDVGCDIQAIDCVAGYLPRLPSEQLEALSARLEAVPKPGSGADLMAAEYAYAKSQQDGNFVMLAMVNSMEPFYKDAGVGLDAKTPVEFDAWVDGQMASYAANPLVKLIAPSLKSIRRTLAVAQAKQPMLRTAIDVQSHGESAAARSLDPFGTGPFKYLKTSTGFELSSQLQDRNGPVRLVVGK